MSGLLQYIGLAKIQPEINSKWHMACMDKLRCHEIDAGIPTYMK